MVDDSPSISFSIKKQTKEKNWHTQLTPINGLIYLF